MADCEHRRLKPSGLSMLQCGECGRFLPSGAVLAALWNAMNFETGHGVGEESRYPDPNYHTIRDAMRENLKEKRRG